MIGMLRRKLKIWWTSGLAPETAISDRMKRLITNRMNAHLFILVAILAGTIIAHSSVRVVDTKSAPHLVMLAVITLLGLNLAYTIRHLVPIWRLWEKFGDAGKPAAEDQNRPNVITRLKSFPWPSLMIDFVVLGVLVGFTGGITSLFTPLFVVGILMSDISIADAKSRIWLSGSAAIIMGGAAFLSYKVKSGDWCWSVVDSRGERTCFETVWKFEGDLEWAVPLALFVISVGFGSAVMNLYVRNSKLFEDEAAANDNQQT